MIDGRSLACFSFSFSAGSHLQSCRQSAHVVLYHGRSIDTKIDGRWIDGLYDRLPLAQHGPPKIS